MDSQMRDEIADTAIKLDEIRESCPEDYFYIKGWIHCLMLRENFGEEQLCRLVAGSSDGRRERA